jgi:hypothetical protein
MGSDRLAPRSTRGALRRAVGALVASAMLSASAAAWAEPTAEDRETARNLMKQGD